MPQNSFIASLRLLHWLLFTPSAWQRYIAQIDEQLSPAFALAHLSNQHWKNKQLWHLLWIGHGLLSFWALTIVCIILAWQDVASEKYLLTLSYIPLLSLFLGLLTSLTVSLAFGICVGFFGGILLGLPVIYANEIIFKMVDTVAVIQVLLNTTSEQPSLILPANNFALFSVLAGVFIASAAGSIMHSTLKTAYQHPPYRQIGSIVIGVIVSSIIAFLVISLVSPMTRYISTLSGSAFTFILDSAINSTGLALGLICLLQGAKWRFSLILGILATTLISLLTYLDYTLAPYSISNAIIGNIHASVENAMLYSVLFTFPYVFAKNIANTWAGVIAGIVGSAGTYVVFAISTGQYDSEILIGSVILAFFAGSTFNWWRPVILYPFVSAWNLLLYHTDEKRHNSQTSLLYYHSAFWDEHQHWPLFGLENYIVLVAERNPKEGKQLIDYLSKTKQSWAAQEAQIELDALRLQACDNVKSISQAYRQLAAGELSGPASALLRTFSRLSRDVEAALSQESNYNKRLALDAIEERLDGLLRELTRSSELYAQRFRPIAEVWRQKLADYAKELTAVVESRQEINNPYIIGVPLTEHQEIFVGRSDVSANIEQLLLEKRCPPLLLYGQRRTGKTSLLNNLGKLLPSTIIPLFVDLQGPASLAKEYSSFLYNIGRAMTTSAKRHRELIFPVLDRKLLNEDPFTVFDEWLDEIERTITPEQTILLTLDEFSTLEHAFSKGYLDENSVLGMIRHIIQHRPRFKLLLSGSNTIDEFERWASYLINVRTVHLSFLQANEALQLIEQPVKNFELLYTDEASQRVMQITNCHPALIQLVCAEIVSLKNKQHVEERRLAHFEDAEAAIPGALQHGRFFFADISNNQITPDSLVLLKFIAEQGEAKVLDEAWLRAQYPDNFEQCIDNLLQRELIIRLGNGYRFQVELIRHWFLRS
ncbi:MAG: hypothetical protein VSS52_012170 [Thiotrichaceae bacterium]|nr:hypothetical protein [Thiotrichaceae bacterium]